MEVHGHRGCRGLRPENTIPAFLHALELGVDVLELDVVLSADGHVVVSHDPFIDPSVCFIDKKSGLYDPIDTSFLKLTYDQIARYNCGNVPNDEFPNQIRSTCIKPLLVDMIREVEAFNRNRKVNYNIELKYYDKWKDVFQPGPVQLIDSLLNVIDLFDIADRVVVQSFNVNVLNSITNTNPKLPLGLILEPFEDMNHKLSTIKAELAHIAPWFGDVTDMMVLSVHQKGVKIIPWTVNEIPEMKSLIHKGVDGIITDYPDRLKQLLR